MGARIAIVLRDAQPVFEILQAAKEGEAAPPADPGALEEGGAGRIGRGFLRPGEGEEAAHGRLLTGGEHAHSGLARAGRDRRSAKDERQDHDPGRLLHALSHADDVTAGNMAELMSDHALHFIGIVGRSDQAGMKIDDLAAGTKR